MKSREIKSGERRRAALLVPFLLVFCILGAVVYSVAQRISEEMSLSAINNLDESLDLIGNTIETILGKEAEFQVLIAQEMADSKNPEDFVLSYERNSTMVKISLIRAGDTEGISNTGDVFTEEELDFTAGKTVDGLPLSSSYMNDMGTWAYTMKCPIISDDEEVATLYIEYIYDSFDEALPNDFYNSEATLYMMDAASRKFVMKPKGMGERDAGHMNLDDFYHANKIREEKIKKSVDAQISEGNNMMFYHDIQNQDSLIYMWSVNEGVVYLIGYVPVQAIQREGDAVNQNMFIVVAVMLAAFVGCCLFYLFYERQQRKIQKDRETEREIHNKQLKEALQTAQIANNSKTTFLSNMSHDIRTPMNAILGFATLLAKDIDNQEKVLEYTKKITASGQHLLSLINDVLDISKIESGKVILSVEEFALKDMISSIDAIIRPAAEAKRQNFDIAVTGIKHEHLIGDETRLNQILINLLSNAVKYTQEGGNIWLRIIGLEQHSSQLERIRFEVEDNGYGMTEEFLETIFDAFTRAENSTTNKVQGTGLGMAITKNIVELMGGMIQVYSEVDQGSLFTVDLELRIPEIDAIREESGLEGTHPFSLPMEDGSLEGRHFLVAEDNEINAEIIEELLDIEEATCEIVRNGKLAVERFSKAEPGSYDAVLMDIQMPVMNGYEATRAIRALKRQDAKLIPIIAMTANAFAEDVKDAMDAGMDAHIAKPVDMELLKQTLSLYLR